MRKPRVLILDEPTAMLGVRENEKLLSIIRSARSQGLAVIFITHHVEEVVEVADQVSLMKDGALVESFVMSEHTDADFIVGKLVGKSCSKLGDKQAPGSGRQVFAIHDLSALRGERAEISVSAGEVVGLYGVRRFGLRKAWSSRCRAGGHSPEHDATYGRQVQACQSFGCGARRRFIFALRASGELCVAEPQHARKSDDQPARSGSIIRNHEK